VSDTNLLRARWTALGAAGKVSFTNGRRLASALLLACGLAACAHTSSLERPAGKPVKGGVTDLSGRPVLVSSLQGQVVLLDFFATWCEPCKKGLPRTQALVEANASRGLAGRAVSLDDRLAVVAPFVAEQQLGLPVWYDEGGALADELGVEKLPTVVLLDRAGAVRFVHFGASDQDEAEVVAAVERLLRER
jgi:cytochrome c biogenesis protein CcmG, thiol:disulfide interchange protein DsbE